MKGSQGDDKEEGTLIMEAFDEVNISMQCIKYSSMPLYQI